VEARPSGAVTQAGVLPEGVELLDLAPQRDERGMLVELFRRRWPTGVDPVQWNMITSTPNALRGVHLHPVHTDYLIVLQGRVTVGVADLRSGRAEGGVRTTVALSGDAPQAIVIPNGVAHGFFFHDAAIHVYAVTHYWSTDDELACRWDDPDLAIPWPAEVRVAPLLSERDAAAGDLAELLEIARPLLPATQS
jgi:dTDP-4-dehydrorhamnose 3,5-epimerase